MTLRPDVALSVQLDAILHRHRYDTDPAAALTELTETAGDRADVLAEAAGTWAGYFGRQPGTSPALVAALKTIPGAAVFVPIGERRHRGGSQSSASDTPDIARIRTDYAC